MAYSENDLVAKMLHHLGEATSCAKGIAQLRKDSRWFAFSQVLQNVTNNVKLLYNARGMSFQQSNELLERREAMIANEAAQQRLKERVEAAHADYRSGN